MKSIAEHIIFSGKLVEWKNRIVTTIVHIKVDL